MKCFRCQQQNPSGVSFCGECGARLESLCAVTGDTVNTASRLQSAAQLGQTLVSAATYRPTQHAFDFELVGDLALKGKTEPLRVQLQPLGARGPDELDRAFSAIIRERAGALLVFPDPVFFAHRTRLADFAAKNHLPAMYGLTPHVVAGGLMAAASITDLFRRADGYVDKILKGAKPADLPVERPTVWQLVINMKTAKALGLTIPDSALFRADRVIK